MYGSNAHVPYTELLPALQKARSQSKSESDAQDAYRSTFTALVKHKLAAKKARKAPLDVDIDNAMDVDQIGGATT